MPDAPALLARALDHLAQAATTAEATDPHLAGQIRLAAATLPGDPTQSAEITEPGHDVATQLERALDCLDQIPPLAGPRDRLCCTR